MIEIIKIKLLRKAVEFLKQHADLLSNNSCNDIYEEFYDGWSDEEKKELVEMLNKWNGHDENLNEEYKNLMYHDSVVCSFVADLLNDIFKDFIPPIIPTETDK